MKILMKSKQAKSQHQTTQCLSFRLERQMRRVDLSEIELNTDDTNLTNWNG
jgi:hypothetical protein